MGDLLSLFANNLLPVFLAAGAGFLLGKTMKIEVQTLSRAAFYVFSPCLIFTLLTKNEMNGGEVLKMGGFAMVQILLVGGVAWLVASRLQLKRELMVAVVLAAMMPNAGNFGLSVELFAFGEKGLAYASVYFIASAILANTVGVYVASLGRSSYREALTGLLKIPALYAVLLALLFLGMGWTLPGPVAKTVDLFAGATIPLMLVLLGLMLQQASWSGRARELWLAGGLRLLVSPVIALGVAMVFGLQGVMRQSGILEAAMPTAVLATVLATEFEVEPSFVTAAVFITTLLSPLTLTPLLAWLGR